MNNETLREEAISASGLSRTAASGLGSTATSGLGSTDFTLKDFNYENNVIQEVVLRNLYKTNFIGVTVSFTITRYSCILYIGIAMVFAIHEQVNLMI